MLARQITTLLPEAISISKRHRTCYRGPEKMDLSSRKTLIHLPALIWRAGRYQPAFHTHCQCDWHQRCRRLLTESFTKLWLLKEETICLNAGRLCLQTLDISRAHTGTRHSSLIRCQYVLRHAAVETGQFRKQGTPVQGQYLVLCQQHHVHTIALRARLSGCRAPRFLDFLIQSFIVASNLRNKTNT